jgi:glycosyltransferase involved in cell wall biosynthesis
MATHAEQPVPLRVLHVTEATGGGVRWHLRRVVPALRQLGLAVDVLLGTGRAEADVDEDLAEYRSLGCGVAVFGGTLTLATLASGIPALRQAVRERRPDVVHLHATRAGLLGRLALGRPGGPALVYSPHAFVFQPGVALPVRWLGRWLERRLAPRTAAFVCVSPAERELALATLPVSAERVHVIENGLDSAFAAGLLPRTTVRAEWGIPAESVLIGFCGRLVRQKDPGTLLRGFAALPDRPALLRLAVCGSGPLAASLRRLASALGLADSVTWLGYVPGLARRLAAFDLLALPSRYEGLSYVLLEALAAGVPVVAADIPANRLRGCLSGARARAPGGDPEAWAEALSGSLSSLSARRAQSQALAPQVLHEFSLQRQAAALAALYATLAQGPKRPRPA